MCNVNLNQNSIKWALKHILHENDTDLFPKLKEFDFFKSYEEDLLTELGKINIGEYNWQSYRRFIIPKAEYSYRIATQLDPIDSILFAAIIYEYGEYIEKKRIPIADNKVFSYRFRPSEEGELYDKKDAWRKFWTTAKTKMESNNIAIYIDIADFYDRIYHHKLESQLDNCCFPNQVKKALKKFLQNITQTVSQGIPTGPHPSHLLAEMCLIPVDESLTLKGIEFCRYADDILIFTDSTNNAKLIIYEMAKMLDSIHLTMQRQKTRVFNKVEFINHCDNMLNDNPINDLEQNIINALKKYSTNPYAVIDLKEIEDSDKIVFREDNIKQILDSYMSPDIDYQRIRWLYRRLAQVGVDTAISLTLNRISDLIPVISDISFYFLSVANSSQNALNDIGNQLIKLLDNKIIQSNDYFQIAILSLFDRSEKFNNIDKLINLYQNSNEHLKREIILAGLSANATSWIMELKQQYSALGNWSRNALIMASSLLPRDERKFFIQSIHNSNGQLTSTLLEKYIKAL